MVVGELDGERDVCPPEYTRLPRNSDTIPACRRHAPGEIAVFAGVDSALSASHREGGYAEVVDHAHRRARLDRAKGAQPMKLGVIFPQTECGTDVKAIGEFTRAVEAEGFDHLFVADHVLGADPKFHSHPALATYSHEAVVHEALTLMAYFAAITTRITLATGILILPQRQAALVAKQAAEVDVLSGGRLRLGIGVGWNAVEYEALNEDFHNRGARSEEQIQVLRALWTGEATTFDGNWHHIDAAGIKPLPVQRPIPIWIGGGAEATLRRAGRIGDGWFPQMAPDERAGAMVERLRLYTREAGRADSAVGI